MKKYRRYLPSFDALVFFEAAARHQSFTRSAEELYVTQAAVSKRVRDIESRLGVKLFIRNGRTLELTQPGRRLLERTTMTLEYLEDACREAVSDFSESVRITTNSAVSLFWLAPRLKAFGLSNNSSNVNLVTSDRSSDHASFDNDLAISYGFSETPGWSSDLLFNERLLPVAATGYFARLDLDVPQSIDDLENVASSITLLEYDRLAPDWINWSAWIEKTKTRKLLSCKIKRCRSYAHSIGEAINGHGLALGSLPLIDEEIKLGQLQTIGSEEITSGRDYYLISPENKRLNKSAQKLRSWLMNEEQILGFRKKKKGNTV